LRELWIEAVKIIQRLDHDCVDGARLIAEEAYNAGLEDGRKPDPRCKCMPPRGTKPLSLHGTACPVLIDGDREAVRKAITELERL
ncbi:MAG: hypothetical protein ACYTEQ_25925, partial [Planctomycetota bacterium]|jgi:hypothetical protein